MRRTRIVAAVVGILSSVVLLAPPADAVRAVGGGAFGIGLNLPINGGIGLRGLPSVTMGPFGGHSHKFLPDINVPGVVFAHALRAEVTGSPVGPVLAHANADIVRAVFPLAGASIEINGIHSDCLWREDRTGAQTRIGSVVFNGVPLIVALNPAPNTVYDLGIIRLVFNAQSRRTLPDLSEVITVDAVQAFVDTGSGIAQVVLARSACDPRDFHLDTVDIVRQLLGGGGQ
jgi:hypothetical protein